jgi:hypothetical protein
MNSQNSQLTGTSGAYFVMAKLAANGFHASCTMGNAPNVDVLVSTKDGRKSIALQVKTTGWAVRTRGRGKNKWPHHLEFPLGYPAAKTSRKHLYFAFVDLKEFAELPDMYIIPSRFIKNYCRNWVEKVRWVRFHIGIEELKPYKNNLGIIKRALR